MAPVCGYCVQASRECSAIVEPMESSETVQRSVPDIPIIDDGLVDWEIEGLFT